MTECGLPADARGKKVHGETPGLVRDLRHAVGLLADAGAIGSGCDLDEETSRIYVLHDGLAMHGALMPERYPPEHQQRLLESHLRELRSQRP